MNVLPGYISFHSFVILSAVEGSFNMENVRGMMEMNHQ